MDSNNTDNNDNNNNETVLERYEKAAALIESSPREAFDQLIDLLRIIPSSFRNSDTIDDCSTPSLVLLTLEYHIAMALIAIPVSSSSPSPSSSSSSSSPQFMKERLSNLQSAIDYLASFLQKLERLDLLDRKTEGKQLETLLELQQQQQQQQQDDDNDRERMLPPPNRNVKIARYQAKREAQQEKERLMGLLERRQRLGIQNEEDFDGYDHDSLVRAIALTTLKICKADAFDEWTNTLREMPLVVRRLQSEQQQHPDSQAAALDPREASSTTKPLQVTHITQTVSGRLQIRQEEIRSQVFRPSWNQPTMSLEELAERELHDAMEREERQKQQEAQASHQPRRYEQLQKDGCEDNADLVDASAQLDRNWDDWKDENPRGSGNKRGDVGDRNF